MRMHRSMWRSRALCVPLLVLAALAWPWRAATAAPAGTAQERLLILSYHDVRDQMAGGDDYAVSTQNFAAHLDWLAANGYHAVSLQQLIDAARGVRALPPRPVLLTFDDGLGSVYTRVYPLLRAYRFPAVVAVVSDWIGLPAGGSVAYGPGSAVRSDFVTWAQLREMQDSGLVEIASHSADLHHGVPSNPQGNSTPAAVTRIYDAARRRYESEAEYRARILADLQRSSAAIAEHTGRRPRAIVWPYAAYNRVTSGIARQLGMFASFDLEGARTDLNGDLSGLARLLVTRNPGVAQLAESIYADPDSGNSRSLQVDLDDVYDRDPKQQERNLDALLERVKRIGPNKVFLQAFADPDGNGSADALYFPNRFMPMRADLFNRVAWQLRTRAGAEVYAWLPVLGFELPDRAQREALAIHGRERDGVFRLDFTRAETRRIINGIYEDLAAASYLDGLLFHDDAYLRDDELPALAPGDVTARTQALIDFTLQLRDTAETWRPKLKTVRNLYARPVLQAASQAWFAQRLDLFNQAYDYTAVMAMPWMERAASPEHWLDRLVARVKHSDPQLQHTLFELQTEDWNSGRPIPGARLQALVRRLQAQGVKHIGWYPDDFIGNHPDLPTARASMSLRGFPYEER